MLIIGGDIGHKNTKICFGKNKEQSDLFKSTVEDASNDVLGNKKDILINYNGRDYAVGTEYGAYSVEDDKTKDGIFRICLFTAIARAMNRQIDNINLVTGLPLNYYKRYKNSLAESLEGETIRINYMSITKIINLQNVKVYPESAGVIIINPSLCKGPVLIIDIGGRTVDVSYFEDMKLIKTGSYDLGMLTLYSTIAKHVNEHYPTDYSVLAAENIIKNQFIVSNDEEIQFDTSHFLKAHTAEILRRIRLDFAWKTSRKKFVGGGSVALKKYLPGTENIKDEDIFANAKAFYEVGVDKYGR
jgi:plasmid segregation protein ParM